MKRTASLIVCVTVFAAAPAQHPVSTDHWSFRPVLRPAIPQTNGVWPRNAIDRFIVARLEAARLAPAPAADRATLLRRLKFDLLGLPPTPAELDAFVHDPDANAYERLVDSYLASPHFGERWARHWLDVVRFAESDGFEMNQARPSAWPYRDWVIGAINADMPYDRFIIEQLAGDQFGADAATGFLVGGAYDRVKSPDPALTLMQRADELHDMVSTTASTFLGLTAGCARCHDHKFDPIAQVDYYALKAIFAGVQHGERPLPGGERGRRPEAAAALRRQLAEITRELEALEPLARPGGPPGRAPVNPRRNVERFAPVQARFVRFIVLATNNLEPCLDELEIFAAGDAARNLALAVAGARPTSSGSYSAAPQIHRLEHVNDGKYGNSRSWISNQVGAGWVQLELKEPAVIDRVAWGRDREGKYVDRLATKYRLEVALKPGLWQVVATSDDRLPFGAEAPLVPPGLPANKQEHYRSLTSQRVALEKRLAEVERATMVYAGAFTVPEPTFRLNRGDPTQKREPVAPAALAQFGSPLKLAADTPDGQRRLALARWIAGAENPLTARVIVNRLWHYHFGAGLVDTPSDFGRNGARPTHPQLLDWLAAELVASGWSLKHIHRLIVTSATYRQSSDVRSPPAGEREDRPTPQLVDAGTRLLWRYPPHRLEAEPLRDAILAVSGNLDTRMGGPGFDLFEPNTNYVKVYNPKQSFGPAEWRRMIYQSKPRMQLDDTFGSFDCPDAGQIAPRRNRSTTALQALNLLNGRFLVQQSQIFAERVRREAGPEEPAQVRHAFRLAFLRDPAAEEETAAAALVREHGLRTLCRALFNANEFVSVR